MSQGTAPTRATTTTGRKPRAGGTLAHVDELIPEDLKQTGWEMREHVGKDKDRFQCHNSRLKLTTTAQLLPQSAIAEARRLQKQSKDPKKLEPVALEKLPVLARETRVLPVPLTPTEIEARLIEWVDLDTRKAELEAEAKRIADDFKGQVSQISAESAGVQKQLKARAEEREVETKDLADYANKTVRMIRLDTNEEYDTRPMTQEELKQSQVRLPSV